VLRGVAAVVAQGAPDPVGDPAGGEPRDAVPAEWRELQAWKEFERRREQERKRRRARAAALSVAVVAAVAAAIAIGTLGATKPQAPVVLPAAVQQFARTLPPSQRPNSAGIGMVDGTDGPNTWRVAWETGDAAFCFAFVHQGAPAQTVCDAAGSVTSAKMRIAGVLEDAGLDPPEPFVCGYTTGPSVAIGYVEINDGQVVGTASDIGSGLSGYCVQMPDSWTAGTSFTVSTFTGGEDQNGKYYSSGISATYP
jgi:hypothetical protein